MPRIIHFEIHAADPDRAAAFYRDAFGWSLQHVPALDYWVVDTGQGEGINGGMIRRRGDPPVSGAPENAFVCTVGVDDLDTALAGAIAAGATLAVPKTSLGPVGWSAYVTDPEGNILGLFQDTSAA